MFQFISVGWILFIGVMIMTPPTIAALAAFRQTKLIHILVNSQLTSVKAELAMARDEIDKLKEFIVSKDEVPPESQPHLKPR